MLLHGTEDVNVETWRYWHWAEWCEMFLQSARWSWIKAFRKRKIFWIGNVEIAVQCFRLTMKYTMQMRKKHSCSLQSEIASYQPCCLISWCVLPNYFKFKWGAGLELNMEFGRFFPIIIIQTWPGNDAIIQRFCYNDGYLSIGHANEYPTIHYFGIPRHT